ncbi:MAG TPA: hypothetical protein VGJ81_22940 [Thermoanaerobaculia bacterium]
MSAPLWFGYAGMITGCIGTVTGIAGSVMGYVSLRRVRRLKALDLRLELRKAEADARAISSELPALLEKADRSRVAVAAFEGWVNSGAMGLWKSEVAADKTKVRTLLASVPVEADHRTLSPEELESKIVATYGLRAAIDQMHDKYVATLAADERKRT